jgi:hypothetical protein
MEKLRIYEESSQVSIKAADRLTGSVLNDREDAQALPAFSSGWLGAQVRLFIQGQ